MAPIEQLRREFIYDLQRVPYFIDGKVSFHKMIWENLQYLIRLMSRLTNETILPDHKINSILLETEVCLYTIHELNKKALITDIELSYYILSLLEKYEDKAVDLELYEVCENILRYKTKYINL
jgi:hypothetical protein